MSTTLSNEEFYQLNEQLVELKASNYNLETALGKSKAECESLKGELDRLRSAMPTTTSSTSPPPPSAPASHVLTSASKVKGKLLKLKSIVSKAGNIDVHHHHHQEQQGDDQHNNLNSFSLEEQEQSFIKSHETLKEEIELLESTIVQLNANNRQLMEALDEGKTKAAQVNRDAYLEQFRADLSSLQDAIIASRVQSTDFVNCPSIESIDYDDLVDKIVNTSLEITKTDDDDEDDGDEDLLQAEIDKIVGSFQEAPELNVDSAAGKFKNFYELYTLFQQLHETQLAKLKRLIFHLAEKLCQTRSQLSAHQLKHNEEVAAMQKRLDDVQQEYEDLKQEQDKQSSQMLDMSQSHTNQIDLCEEKHKQVVEKLQAEINDLNQKLVERLNDHKISEKRGVRIIKELKRQNEIEKKRADNLQSRLEEMFAAPNQSTDTIKGEEGVENNDDDNEDDAKTQASTRISSNGSWSYMNDPTSCGNESRRANSANGSAYSELSDGNDFVSVKTTTTNEIERENLQLVAKLSKLQQEKWALEEQVQQLEQRLHTLTQTLEAKDKLVQHLCLRGGSRQSSIDKGQPPPSAGIEGKLNKPMLRMMNFIKEKTTAHGEVIGSLGGHEATKNDEDINRGLKRMVEEVLTNNMNLQNDLEVMSNEVVRLKKILLEYEAKNS